jgi:transposase-like protein
MEIAAMDLAVPRDRDGSFEPQIVRKGQTRLDGTATGSSRCMRAG